MKMKSNPTKVVKSRTLKESKFSVREEDLVILFDILRSKTYSDKIMAVIREYSTNAQDEHVKHGVKRPIEICLPTNMNAVFKVRDFGKGLSEEEIREVYVMYGASTKRQSDDFTGQLGIGCKSGFAYGKTFTITSIQNGHSRVYNAYIDESKVGVVAEMGVPADVDLDEWQGRPIDEPDGIEITIPVKIQDVSAFRERAKVAFSFFDQPPKIINDPNFEFENLEYLYEGKGWKICKKTSTYYSRNKDSNDNRSVAVMGNIGYPLNSGSVPSLTEAHRQMLNSNIHVRFEIGELNIASSREALEYDDDTCKAIAARMDVIIKELCTLIEKEVKQSTNLWDAKLAYHKFVTAQLNFVAGPLKAQGYKWKGHELDNLEINWERTNFSTDDVELKEYQYNRSNDRLKEITNRSYWGRKAGIDHFNVDEGYVFFENDDSKKWRMKVKQHINELKADPKTSKQHSGYNTKVYVFTFKDDATKNKFWKSLDLETFGPTLKKMTDITLPEIVKGVNTAREMRQSCSAFELAGLNNRTSVLGDYWTPCTIDGNKSGVYVPIFKYKAVVKEPSSDTAQDGIEWHPDDLTTFLKNWEKAGLPKIDIKGIKAKSVKSLGDKWVSLYDHVQSVLKTHSGKLQTIGVTIANNEASRVVGEGTVKFYLDRAAEFTGPNGRFIDFVKKAKEVLDDSQVSDSDKDFMKVCQSMNFHQDGTYKPKYNLQEERDKLIQQYPCRS